MSACVRTPTHEMVSGAPHGGVKNETSVDHVPGPPSCARSNCCDSTNGVVSDDTVHVKNGDEVTAVLAVTAKLQPNVACSAGTNW